MLLGQVAVRRHRAGGADYRKQVKKGHDGRATAGSKILNDCLQPAVSQHTLKDKRRGGGRTGETD